MSSSSAAVDRPPATTTTTRRDASYSRKQKSLSLLCSNFLSLYNRDDGATALIGLDDAASRLGVVRRRIYDIVNVLESVGLLSRKSKNTYTWKGFGAVPNALKELREEGLDLTPIPAACNNNNNPQDETKREKSLALLAQNFVKLFVCTGSESESESISLDEAAKLLLGVGDPQNVSVMRTKVRRIYDIANVLSSVNLIEKTHTADTGKPAYRWLGLNGRRDGLNLNSEQAKKRSFGTDLTNASSKRSKVVEKRVQDQGEVENCNSDGGGGAKESSKSYQFGPFAPVAVPRARKGVDVNKVCWESLGAYYRPQYQNQAMKELFSHYREAWMLWNSQVAEKNPIQSS